MQFTSHLLDILCVGNTLMNVLCKFFPCIFGLLSKKTEARYTRIYMEVLNRCRRQGNNPDNISVDFMKEQQLMQCSN